MINTIAENIKETIRPMYMKQAESKAEWIFKIKEIRESDEFLALKDEYERYGYLFNLGYANSHINLARSQYDHILKCTTYDAERSLGRIDVAVSKKIKRNDIVKCELIHTETGKDGFIEGKWKLITENDESAIFEFETIYAGGYNIQCFHVRTKYKMSKFS